jgi:hypothetical protein
LQSFSYNVRDKMSAARATPTDEVRGQIFVSPGLFEAWQRIRTRARELADEVDRDATPRPPTEKGKR